MTTPDTDRARIVERLRAGDICDVELAPKLADLIEQDGRTIEALREEIARQRKIIDPHA